MKSELLKKVGLFFSFFLETVRKITNGPLNGPDGPPNGPDGLSNGPDGPSNGPDDRRLRPG